MIWVTTGETSAAAEADEDDDDDGDDITNKILYMANRMLVFWITEFLDFFHCPEF
jgi:hypothetical protein